MDSQYSKFSEKRKQSRRDAVLRRRRKIKKLVIEYLGGKCIVCGYNKCVAALEAHHIGIKGFGISAKGYTRSWEKIKEELDKCELLCANCHREKHFSALLV